MKRLFFMQDGYLCEVIPAENFSVDDMKVGRDIPENVTSQKVEHDTLPDPILRGAWKLNGSNVDVDMVKGKEVCHTIRREKRDEFMADNLEIIQKNAVGIPLAPGEDATAAANANAAYKSDVDDVAQNAIESATSESELLSAIAGL